MTTDHKAITIVIAVALFFISGAAALIYEVLWMKELSLLFGNSAQAASATLAAFFAGIAAGNAFWGRRSSQMDRPLRVYGLLEIGVAVSAVFYFGVLRAYDSIYGALFSFFGDAPALFTLIKFTLSFVLFFPSAFFMGGTLPVMTQFLVRRRDELGKHATTLYALNTFGAATGAFAAGFLLPQWLGFNVSYLAAMAGTVLIAAIALLFDKRLWEADRAADSAPSQEIVAEVINPEAADFSARRERMLVGLAGLSGFTALGLQVLWIRMFAQVLHNSVYTYATILSVFLLSLAVGGAIAREAARRKVSSKIFLPLLLSASGLLVAASPVIFQVLTSGGAYLGGDADFAGYMIRIVTIVAAVIGAPVTVLGVLLPYLFKLAETSVRSPGESVGRLVTINTLSAIAGSVVAGFLLLGWLGLWPSLRLMAILYFAAAFWVVIDQQPKSALPRLAPVMGLIVLITVLDTSRLPLVRIDPVKKNETLLKVWEGADGTVAVVRQDGHLRTKLNNWYTLGSTDDMTTQQVQTHLPMLLHENPKRVFYLGLGTGITAGAALNYAVEEVLVAEIAPSVIKASREFFSDHTNGLFDDPRATVVAEDGRNVLRGANNDFDLIISDLFIPWKAGTGTLYAVEHYRTAKRRLRKGGLYVQWAPLYQMTEEEFSIIARSMLEVFPTVTLWRGNFWPDRPVVAMIGHRDPAVLEAATPIVASSMRALEEHQTGDGDTVPLLAHYAGLLTRKHPMIGAAPINTDNLPIIEYRAPINHRREKAGQVEWFVGEPMLDFMAGLVEQDALEDDAYFSQLHPAWRKAVQAGYYFHAAKALEKWEEADAAIAEQAYRDLLQSLANEMAQRTALQQSIP